METFGYRLKKVRREKKLRQCDLAKALGLAQTTIANYEQNTRFPDQKNLSKMATYLNVSLDYMLGVQQEITPPKSVAEKDGTLSFSVLSNEYLNSLLGGNKEKAERIIKEAIQKGVSISDIYLNVLEPSLKELGKLWDVNSATVAQEHFCTFVTEQIMSKIFVKGNVLKKNKAIAVTVSGELHEIGLRMVSDLLEIDGWSVYYLGSNTPTRSIIDAIRLNNPNILIISGTIKGHIDGIDNLIKVIRSSNGCESIKIMVGGQAFNEEPHIWKGIGADGYSINARDAVSIANKLIID